MIPYTRTTEETMRETDYDRGYAHGKQNIPSQSNTSSYTLGYCEGLWDRRCHEVLTDDGC